MDYTTIVSAVDFDTALVAIGGIAAATAAIYLGVRGARIVMAFLKR